MKFNFQLIEYIIYLEFFLVVLLVLVAFGLKIFFTIKNKELQRVSLKIDEFFLKALDNQVSLAHFPEKAKRFKVLLPAIKTMDDKFDDARWKKLKENIAKEVLYKLAKKAAFYRRWNYRFFAAESFKMYMEKTEEPTLIKLIKDKYPLVTLSAGAVAIKYELSEAIDALINRMSPERRLAISMYLTLFEGAGDKIYYMVIEKLKKSNDPYIRATCYKILQKLNVNEKFADYEKDLETNKLELKLSVIRYLTYLKEKKAIKDLVKLLKSDEWEVRAIAVQSLGELDAVSEISNIANLLTDREWWVRVNAAMTLKKLGSEGIEILKAQNPTKDKFAYDAAQYVLESNQMKEK